MKAWMRVSVTEWDRYGRSLEMFLRWKKAFLEMDLMWDRKERVESRMTPQVEDLRGWADGNAINQKDEITHLLEQCRGRHNQELCFLAVEFK